MQFTENEHCKLQSLTFKVAEEEFRKRNLEFGPVQMRTLGMINEEGIYSNLGLLLSDQCPHIIKAATLAGTDQEHFQDRKEFEGSLLKQLSDAYYYLDMRNQLQATFRGLYRTDKKDYPEAALREALLNAIVHRDYGHSAPTLLSVYDDRVEMISYGGLPADSTMEDIMMGLSVCRNPGLADIFYRLNLIESYGTGIAKILKFYRQEDRTPEFYSTPHAFKVILPNCNYAVPDIPLGNKNVTSVHKASTSYAASISHAVGCTEEEAKVLDLIRKKGIVSRTDVEALTGMSPATSVRLLRRLRNIGAIRTQGNGKNTKYTI